MYRQTRQVTRLIRRVLKDLSRRHALLQFYEPVQDQINLRCSLRIGVGLRCGYNDNETSIRSDVKGSRSIGVIQDARYWKLHRFSGGEAGFSPDVDGEKVIGSPVIEKLFAIG